MLIKLIRNQPNGDAITGYLVIDGRWFCDTLERVGYQIPALCYHVCVTRSPRFKRLLPIVQNVPQRSGIRFHRGSMPEHSTGCILTLADNKIKTTQTHASIARDRSSECEIRKNRSSVCEIRTCASAGKFNKNNLDNLRPNQLPGALEVNNNIGYRTSADVEQALTSILLKAQEDHEEIILEIRDYRLGTPLGYDTKCPAELQMP